LASLSQKVATLLAHVLYLLKRTLPAQPIRVVIINQGDRYYMMSHQDYWCDRFRSLAAWAFVTPCDA
jgi:hypothetical protein